MIEVLTSGVEEIRQVALDGFATKCPEFAERLVWARNVAASDARVLIAGGMGTGKSRLARAIHAGGTRAAGPFVEIDLAELTAEGAERAVFGAEGGLAGAAGGTLVLGGLLAHTHGLVARVLRATDPWDGPRADVRLILTCAEDDPSTSARLRLPATIAQLLPEVTIDLPALRDRREDVVDLFLAFVALAGGTVERLLDEAEKAMLAYDWPGNLRELRSVAYGVTMTAAGGVVRAADVLRHVRRTEVATAPAGRPTAKQASLAYAKQVLAQEGGNVSRAARVLDIARTTLIDWMREG